MNGPSMTSVNHSNAVTHFSLEGTPSDYSTQTTAGAMFRSILKHAETTVKDHSCNENHGSNTNTYGHNITVVAGLELDSTEQIGA